MGVGTEYRRDDRIGLVVARNIKSLQLPNVTVVEELGEGVALMAAWAQAENVIIIDAVSSGAVSGTIFRIDANAEQIPSKFFHYSTHEFGVAEAGGLARVLHATPTRLILYGIEGADFGWGTEISPEVEKVSEEVISFLLDDISSFSLNETNEL
ncbi:MAG: hydrogenase maturation protease [Ignavibacteriales bacterium]|nr:hydrogenase maturation protease [Ignavibacteriales bacterium]